MFSGVLNAAEIKIKMGGEKFVFDDILLKQRPETPLAQMFLNDSGKPQQEPDEEGFYAIEGDPNAFVHILNFWKYEDAGIRQGVDLDYLATHALRWGAYDFLCFIKGLKKGLDKSEMSCGATFRAIDAKSEDYFNTEIQKLEKDFYIISVDVTQVNTTYMWNMVKVVPKIPKK
jgi:hypothetical protein